MKRIILIVTLLCAAPSHAGVFTVVTNGYLWQSTNYLNELQTTYREHIHIATKLYTPVIEEIEAGDIIQGQSLWRTWQDWGSNNAHFFVNDQAALTNIILLLPMLTYTGLLQQVGLTNGLRRVDKETEWVPTVNNWTNYSDSMYSYGHMETGDIHGPWVLVDLQKVYNAMKWTVEHRDNDPTSSLDPFTVTNTTRWVSNAVNAVEATAKATLESGWSDIVGVTQTETELYSGVATVTTNAGPSYTYAGKRIQGGGIFFPEMTNLEHSASVYLKPEGYPLGFLNIEFADVDNQGWLANRWYFYENLPLARTYSRTNSPVTFTSSSSAPSFTIPVNPPATTNFYEPGARVREAAFIYKWAWSFTNK